MLVRADEDDGLRARDSLMIEQFPQIAPRRRRQRDADDLLQLVDGTRCAGAAGDDAPLRSCVDRVLDGLLRLVEQLAHAAARNVVLGMGVRVHALQALQVGLHEAQAPT